MNIHLHYCAFGHTESLPKLVSECNKYVSMASKSTLNKGTRITLCCLSFAAYYEKKYLHFIILSCFVETALRPK